MALVLKMHRGPVKVKRLDGVIALAPGVIHELGLAYFAERGKFAGSFSVLHIATSTRVCRCVNATHCRLAIEELLRLNVDWTTVDGFEERHEEAKRIAFKYYMRRLPKSDI